MDDMLVVGTIMHERERERAMFLRYIQLLQGIPKIMLLKLNSNIYG